MFAEKALTLKFNVKGWCKANANKRNIMVNTYKLNWHYLKIQQGMPLRPK